MRDIYLIDFENVASEGLSGITYLVYKPLSPILHGKRR